MSFYYFNSVAISQTAYQRWKRHVSDSYEGFVWKKLPEWRVASGQWRVGKGSGKLGGGLCL